MAAFSLSVGLAVYIYGELSREGPTGAGFVSVIIAYAAYWLMTFCNVSGGLVLLLFWRKDKASLTTTTISILFLATVAQLFPLARWALSV